MPQTDTVSGGRSTARATAPGAGRRARAARTRRARARRRGRRPVEGGGGLVDLRSVGTAAALLAWLALTGAVSGSGILDADTLPPRALFFVAASLLVAVAFALSRAGARLAAGLPIAALVSFQAFRLPLELVLHRWYLEGALPVQMTYEANNLDILTGVAAAACGLWLRRRGPAVALVWAFNLLGTALLINVAAVALLSSPLPFRSFPADPPVLLVFHFPHGWIVPFCVAPALAAHLLVFRWLARYHRGP